MRFEAFVPTRLVFGPGRLEEAGQLAQSLGSHALVVTSRSAMDRLGFTGRLLDRLKGAGVAATVFCDLGATPSTDDVDRGAEVARACHANLVIGLGGGSALDCAKAVAGVAPQAAPCADYLHGRATVTAAALPILAIPTTAGTGSEMNRSAILNDVSLCHKDALRSDYLFPRFALVDPTLTHSLPADVTVQTGFDAFAHALESYVSPRSHFLADALAADSMRAVIEALPLALNEPNHAQARERLALASTSMGYNLSTVGTCLPHRLDKPLCARFPHITHGQAIAFFYPGWAASSWPGHVERFARVAALLEPHSGQLSLETAAAACAECLTNFLQRIGLNRRLSSFGVNLTEGDCAALAERVRGDLQVNPVPVEPAKLVDFYRSLTR
jgi:alcohol dehydrogenase class IV